MLTTYELRWFSPGMIPESIETWFKQNCLIDSMQLPEKREDVYLYSPKSDFLGIKIRQGRLEVKWRKAELGAVRFGDFVEGKVEKWGKWLCSDATVSLKSRKSMKSLGKHQKTGVKFETLK